MDFERANDLFDSWKSNFSFIKLIIHFWHVGKADAEFVLSNNLPIKQ